MQMYDVKRDFYRPQQKLRERNVFTGVGLSTRGDGGVSQHAMGRSLCDQGVVTRGCVTDGVCDQGVYTPGLTPPNTVNKRAVCTLLECFLV